MGYFRANGSYADADSVTLAASAAVTASGVGSWIEIGDRTQLRLTLATTAVSGTSPTLDVEIETSGPTAGANVQTIGNFSQQTAAASQRLIFDACDRFVRERHTIGGSATPTVTFSLSGEAV